MSVKAHLRFFVCSFLVAVYMKAVIVSITINKLQSTAIKKGGIYGINTTSQNTIEMYPATVDPVEDVQAI